MFPERFCRLEDVALMSNHRAVLPGQREPEWLRRAAAADEALRALREEQRCARAPRGLARRLRLALAHREA